jgi:HEAT repeat protein
MNKPTFQTVLTALCDESTAFPNRYLPHFSDLAPQDLAALMAEWPGLAKKRKHNLLTRLVELYQEDNLLSFDSLGAALLSDPDEHVRADALRLLADSDDTGLLPRLVELAENDADANVRSRAAIVLGNFIELGELEDISKEAQNFVEEALMRLARSDNETVQRSALEAISFSSRPEVETLIQSAYMRPEPAWVASSLAAMGRSANDDWEELVLAKFDDHNTEIRRRAVQAAGELRLASARPLLLTLLEEEDDEDVFIAVIWSLSQIGGEDVRVALQVLLDQAEDDASLSYLDEAIANLDFTEELNSFDLRAFDPEDDLDQ